MSRIEQSLKSENLGRCALCLAIYHKGLFTIGRPSCIVRDLMSSDGNSNIKVNDPLIGVKINLAMFLSYFKSHSSIVFVVHCDWLNRRWAFAFKLAHRSINHEVLESMERLLLSRSSYYIAVFYNLKQPPPFSIKQTVITIEKDEMVFFSRNTRFSF